MNIFSLSLPELEKAKQKLSEGVDESTEQQTIDFLAEDFQDIECLIAFRTGKNKNRCPVCWKDFVFLRKHIKSRHPKQAKHLLKT